MMGRFCFLKVFLVSVLLLFSFSPGFGRKLVESAVEVQDFTVRIQEAGTEPREIIELMDYKETGPNTNTKAEFQISPPPQR